MDLTYKALDRGQRDLIVGGYAHMGLSNIAIAQMLDCSETEVSLARGRLREAGQIREEIHLDDRVDQKWIEEHIRSPHREEHLRKSYPNLTDACVVPAHLGRESNVRTKRRLTGSERRRSDNFRLRMVARFGARKLCEYLAQKPNATVGISFGYTLDLLIDEVERLTSTMHERLVRRFSTVTIFNYTGDFGIDADSIGKENLAARPLRYCSSALAARLAQALRTRRVVQSHLPGWIPLEPATSQSALVKVRKQTIKVFARYDSYKTIFGVAESRRGDPGLLRSADVLVTGIGPPQSIREYLRMTGALAHPPTELLRSLESVVGDVSTIVLNRTRGLTRESPLTKIFVGPTLADFRFVADAARGNAGRVGVLLVAAGALKAEALGAAIASGIVNQIVIDTSLCDALETRAGAT